MEEGDGGGRTRTIHFAKFIVRCFDLRESQWRKPQLNNKLTVFANGKVNGASVGNVIG